MVSLYIWLSIYTNKEILRIIWKFDLSSRGVLGRIYALSIEVLLLLCDDFPYINDSAVYILFLVLWDQREYSEKSEMNDWFRLIF